MNEVTSDRGPGGAERAEALLVGAVSLHSAAVGLFLLVFPALATRFAGFGTSVPLFFARQAGVFHLVLAGGYAAEHLRSRGVTLLLVAKGAAAIFLLISSLGVGVPWSVPVSAAIDGGIALAVFVAHTWASASRRAPGRMHVVVGDAQRARSSGRR